ncbi:MAG: hypothetical protein ACKO40_03050 [Planctomycetaceae bacterium]
MHSFAKRPRQTCPPSQPRPAAVWLPWIAAPAFFLLPIGGCGGMAVLRRQVTAAAVPLPGPAAPMTTVVAVVPTAR